MRVLAVWPGVTILALIVPPTAGWPIRRPSEISLSKITISISPSKPAPRKSGCDTRSTARRSASSRSNWRTASRVSGSSTTWPSSKGKRFASKWTAPAGLQGTGGRRPGRRDQGRRRPLQGEAPAAVPLHVAARLAQRPERPGLFRRRISPVLPAQPLRLGLGQHALGPRRQQGPGPLAGTADRALPATASATGASPAAPWWTGNTSGFQTATKPLVAAYTSTGRGECIAYSNDRGRTWTEFEGNPVVKHAGRDPRLLWHEPSKQWVMAVYDETDGKQWIAFHTSPDLKKWTFQSRIEGFYECPDLFELPVEAATAPRSGCCTPPTASTWSATSTARPSRRIGRASSSSGTATSTRPRPSATRPTAGASRSAGPAASPSPACRSTSR